MQDALDAGLWKPTALGTVGPTGLITQALRAPSGFLYRSLSVSETENLSLSKAVRSRVSVSRGLSSIRTLDLSGLRHPDLQSCEPAIRDSAWFAVMASDSEHGTYGCLISRPLGRDRRVADLYYAAFHYNALSPQHAKIVAGMWKFFLWQLGQSHYVAVRSYASNARAERHALQLGGFKTFQDLIREHSLDEFLISDEPPRLG
jgi:hypothetical protein